LIYESIFRQNILQQAAHKIKQKRNTIYTKYAAKNFIKHIKLTVAEAEGSR